MDRPPPDLAKIFEHWKIWAAGDELPGRTMANLKTDGLADLLAAGDAPVELSGPWSAWENGRTGPTEVLAALDGAGLTRWLADRSITDLAGGEPPGAAMPVADPA